MLKLKKLQILGFKSFCYRTELKFHGEGIAAIVGPNGCGKSNISDAISWVLGEQSARLLRGVRMEDVIFAGTRDRKPTGMAEVSLTLIDPQVYEGPVSGETEIEIRDEIPEDDWDEASTRSTAAEATEAAIAEVQPGPLNEAGNVEIFGVRPNSPAITIIVPANKPLDSRSSNRAESARSVGGKSLSFSRGNASPCVSQVSLLPRFTCTRFTPASINRRAISSDQPNECKP